MIIPKKYYFILFIAITGVLNGYSEVSTENTISDSSNYIVVKLIDIEGNFKTKDHIINRELNFKLGDTLFLSDTASLIKQANNNLYNTSLFNSTSITILNIGTDAFIMVNVSERWYIWPTPIFEIGDRNFNEWWQDRGKEAGRLEYGIRFRWENFRGRAELLKAVVQTGFTNKFELFHSIPYINKKQKIGIKYGASYSTNSKVAYNTESDRLSYLNSDEAIRKRFYSILETSYRPHIFSKHSIRLTYKQNKVKDTLSIINPNYFGEGKSKQKYFKLSYFFEYDRTNIKAYPTKGYYITTDLSQTGLGVFNDINLLTTDFSTAYFKEINPKLSSAHKAYTKWSSKENIPYFNMYGLGYHQNFIRGFERNVIDAQYYTYVKNALRYKLTEFKHDMSNMMHVQQFEVVPYAFYLSSFVDIGIANFVKSSNTNLLNNETLIGYGLGLDFVTFYDMVFRFEYSFTNFDSNGFFLHFEQAF